MKPSAVFEHLKTAVLPENMNGKTLKRNFITVF